MEYSQWRMILIKLLGEKCLLIAYNNILFQPGGFIIIAIITVFALVGFQKLLNPGDSNTMEISRADKVSHHSVNGGFR